MSNFHWIWQILKVDFENHLKQLYGTKFWNLKKRAMKNIPEPRVVTGNKAKHQGIQTSLLIRTHKLAVTMRVQPWVVLVSTDDCWWAIVCITIIRNWTTYRSIIHRVPQQSLCWTIYGLYVRGRWSEEKVQTIQNITSKLS